MKTYKHKFEQFVMAICKPRGTEPSREQWARMLQLVREHQPFAVVIGRYKKDRYIEIRPYPGADRAHVYANLLLGQLRQGNAVLYLEYGLSSGAMRVCSRDTWSEDYTCIVPRESRPRQAQVSKGEPLKRKVEEKPNLSKETRQHLLECVDYLHNRCMRTERQRPQKNRCNGHGFQRTAFANEVMNWYRVF